MPTQRGDVSSIRVVSNRTGIGLHTLRIWERRYGFPNPERKSDGARIYSEKDIAKLKLISRAIDSGFRAGEVVPLPFVDLERLLDATQVDISARAQGDNLSGQRNEENLLRERVDDSSPEAPNEAVSRILAALANDDIRSVQTTLRAAAKRLGPKKFVADLAQPLARRAGDLWARKELEIRHEHLLTACLTRELHAFHTQERASGPVVVLATLPGEHHALPLEMIAVYLAASGVVARMLGANTPPGEIVDSARAAQAHVVGISVSGAADFERTKAGVRTLLGDLPRRTKLWLGGAGSSAIARTIDPRDVAHITTWDSLEKLLKDFRATNDDP